VASKRHCKFIEVSALLNHRMEELLVGTLRQIRLRQVVNADRRHQQQQQVLDDVTSGDRAAAIGGGLSCLHRAAVVLFRKLFQQPVMHHSSCDDLFKP